MEKAILSLGRSACIGSFTEPRDVPPPSPLVAKIQRDGHEYTLFMLVKFVFFELASHLLYTKDALTLLIAPDCIIQDIGHGVGRESERNNNPSRLQHALSTRDVVSARTFDRLADRERERLERRLGPTQHKKS